VFPILTVARKRTIQIAIQITLSKDSSGFDEDGREYKAGLRRRFVWMLISRWWRDVKRRTETQSKTSRNLLAVPSQLPRPGAF
jgi:hypothetical protein